MFLDEDLELKRIRYALLIRFNLGPKFYNFKSRPNATVEYDTNRVTFFSTDDTTTEYEDYRVVDSYGHISMQFKKTPNRNLVNLRCYPEGDAHFNRGILMISEIQADGNYQTRVILTDSHTLTSLDNIHELSTSKITMAHIQTCLDTVRDDIGFIDYDLLKNLLRTLEPLLEPTIEIEKSSNALPGN